MTDCSTPGLLIASFSYNGKNIAFSKKKDGDGGTEKQKGDGIPCFAELGSPEVQPELVKNPGPEVCAIKPEVFANNPEVCANKPEVVEKELEAPPPSRPPMFSSLPTLALLESVRVSGTVTFVSPQGGIWFSPQWTRWMPWRSS